MEAAKAFEAYMVEMMVKEMRKTIPDGMFSGESTEIFSTACSTKRSRSGSPKPAAWQRGDGAGLEWGSDRAPAGLLHADGDAVCG